jgi:hypothetical protein
MVGEAIDLLERKTRGQPRGEVGIEGGEGSVRVTMGRGRKHEVGGGYAETDNEDSTPHLRNAEVCSIECVREELVLGFDSEVLKQSVPVATAV